MIQYKRVGQKGLYHRLVNVRRLLLKDVRGLEQDQEVEALRVLCYGISKTTGKCLMKVQEVPLKRPHLENSQPLIKSHIWNRIFVINPLFGVIDS